MEARPLHTGFGMTKLGGSTYLVSIFGFATRQFSVHHLCKSCAEVEIPLCVNIPSPGEWWYFHNRDILLLMATQLQSQPAAACPICDGTGWKQVAIPGKASRMTRCDCRISSRNQQLVEKAGIPARYKNCTLANFNLEMHEISLSVRNAHRDA